MKITIIGGSQGTGAELAKAALVGGHDVTVLSRSGKAPAGAAVITGSAGRWRALRETEAGTLAKSISRADLGAYLMQILDDESTFGQAIGISGR